MKVAAGHLDPCFLLLYCDNYWPMRFDDMWDRFAAADVPAMVTIYSNRDRYSRDSVRVDEDGFVEVFDRSRKSPGLQGVEISYALLRRSVLELLPEEDALFEEAVYPPLAERGELLAYVTDHRYYSVGSVERLPLTERFLAQQPSVILDRDGVLNERPPKAQYVRSPEEFTWLPGAKAALRLFRDAGYLVIVVSNQAGIGRGAMTEADVTRVHERMKAEATAEGGRIDAVYYCPHDWDEGCDCRKPKPGMLFSAQRDFDLDLTRTPFIGDDERDEEAAEAAGCPALLVSEQAQLLDLARRLVRDRVKEVA
jgi:histidinol-phosphate phosphatase family protein